jgi:hypothetical protein
VQTRSRDRDLSEGFHPAARHSEVAATLRRQPGNNQSTVAVKNRISTRTDGLRSAA